jgi:hypothetical protein
MLKAQTIIKGVNKMIEKIIDVCFAVLIGLMLAGGALAYFDVLIK